MPLKFFWNFVGQGLCGLADMGCVHRLLPLNLFSCVLQIIKKLIERKQAQIRKVYPGLSCFKDGVGQIPVESVPGISMY